jgi:hypothetical protein
MPSKQRQRIVVQFQSSLRGWVCGQCHASVPPPSRKTPENIVQGFAWPQGQSGRVWGRDNVLPPPEVEPLTVLPVLNIFLQILF